jgi:hypothetical protein
MRAAVLFRASSFGLLMTEPKSKSEVLSVGAKTAIRNMAAQAILGVDFEVSDKKLEKGTLVEPDSSGLFNRVFGRAVVKNKQRVNDEFFTGECDHLDTEEIVDIKSAWSAATYPIGADDVPDAQRKLYDYQGRVYMRLYDRPRFRVAYCLVDTPPDLIGNFEPLPLHVVSHIPEHLRVTTWGIERDMGIEAAMVEKAKHARAYYYEVIREFGRTHPDPARIAAPPWEATATPVPTPTKPATAGVAMPAF